MASLAASAANTIAPPAGSATIVRIAGLAGLCAATLVAPALLLVWMPIVLGVPHLANDVRYLVLPLPRAQVVTALAACALLVALKAAALATGVSLLRAEMVVVATWLVVALARGPRTLLLVAGGAAAAIVALPIQFAIVAAFAHNFIAVAAWLVVRRPDRRHVLAVVVAIAAAIAVLVVAGPAVAHATGGDATRWLTIDRAASMMFGGVPLPAARSLLIAFAFLQAVHYAIWLDWIPRRQPRARRSPVGNGRACAAPIVVAATTAVVVGAAVVDAAWTRTTYLALATFHIYLELVVLAAMFAQRRAT